MSKVFCVCVLFFIIKRKVEGKGERKVKHRHNGGKKTHKRCAVVNQSTSMFWVRAQPEIQRRLRCCVHVLAHFVLLLLFVCLFVYDPRQVKWHCY